MRPGFVAGISLALFSVLAAGQQRDLFLTKDPAPRFALLVGNDDYQHVPKLQNSVNDARDLGSRLSDVGFQVDIVTNADRRTFEEAVDRFVSALRPGSVAFFHFSGHGLQIDGENFLVPVDFRVTDEASVRYDTYSASKIHDRMAGSPSRLNVVVLDACRNNGFRRTRSLGGGLAAMNAAEGTFIAFSTSPDSTADDNPGDRNGLFTSYLLQAVAQPGWNLDQVFNDVRRKVYEASGKRQLPWTSSSVIGDFYFQPPSETAPKPVPMATELAVELAYWDTVRDAQDSALLDSYLKRYPEGQFADLARLKLARLSEPKEEPPSTTKTSAPETTLQQDTPQPAAESATPVEVARLRTETAPTVPESHPGVPVVEETARRTVPGSVQRNPGDGLPYIWVPEPVRESPSAEGYWMTQTEITVGAYERHARATGQSLPPAPAFNSNWKETSYPIVSITWDEAANYCRKAGGRLPTEAEWENAALVVTSGGPIDVEAIAWHDGNSKNRPHDVGTKAPGRLDLFDLLGNVAEWCSADSTGSVVRGDGVRHAVRGGSWRTRKGDLKPTHRTELLSGMRNTDVGFRCVIPKTP